MEVNSKITFEEEEVVPSPVPVPSPSPVVSPLSSLPLSPSMIVGAPKHMMMSILNVPRPDPIVMKQNDIFSETDDGWNDTPDCECDTCLLSFNAASLPIGGPIVKSIFVFKNEPDDPKMEFVHPLSLCILKGVQRFDDRFEEQVMHFDCMTFLFPEFMRVLFKLCKNSATVKDWITLLGIHMLHNPQLAMACKCVYGSTYVAYVLQHVMEHGDNPYVTELLRVFLKIHRKCPVLMLEIFRKNQGDCYKNITNF